MPFLPNSIAALVTWAACLALAAVLVRNWVLGQNARIEARVEHLRDREQTLSYARMPVGLRLRTLFEERSRRDAWRPWWGVLGPAGLAGLFTAIVATPLAVVSTRFATDDKALGLFMLFRDAPEGGERMARAVLVVLAFAALVRSYPVFEDWLKHKAQAVGPQTTVGWLLRQLLLAPSFATFYLLGLTPAFLLVLTIAVFAAGEQYKSRLRGQDMMHSLAVHLILYLVLCALLLLIGLTAFYLPGGGDGAGIVSTVLLAGLLLPLASAAGDSVAVFVVRLLSRRIAREWPGVWGLLPYLAVAAVGTVLAVAVFLVALVPALWVYTLIGPEGYTLTLGPAPLERLWDPAYGWPVWVLAAVKFLPLLDLLVRSLALCVTQRSAAMQKSIRLLADRASPAATAEMLIRAHSIGWIAVGLLVVVPMVALLLWQA